MPETTTTMPTDAPATTPGSCCTTDGSCRSTAPAGPVTTVLQVTGMTCGHCEATVARALGGLDGVTDVRAEAATGRVSVTTEGDPDQAAFARALDDAGYPLTGRSS